MRSYRYVNGVHYRVITEDEIRKMLDGDTLKPQQRANAEAVLALDMDQSYEIDSGITYTRIADDSEPVSGFMCGSRPRRRCKFCGALAYDGVLCDGPGKRAGKTCDAFMCRSCRKHVGRNRDLCPNCVKAGAA